ncbi:MAG: hypothetical protein IKQ07_03710 [Bacteroidaceae bacterium]|nr:hypothetical protein [Bacteroidaceae bacterium]
MKNPIQMLVTMDGNRDVTACMKTYVRAERNIDVGENGQISVRNTLTSTYETAAVSTCES